MERDFAFLHFLSSFLELVSFSSFSKLQDIDCWILLESSFSGLKNKRDETLRGLCSWGMKNGGSVEIMVFLKCPRRGKGGGGYLRKNARIKMLAMRLYFSTSKESVHSWGATCSEGL